MAFFNRASNILMQTMNTTSPCIYQTIRRVSNWKLFVGGVGPGTNDSSLREAFRAHGEVSEAKVIVDRKTGRSRGFGFVTFAEYKSACNAIDTMDQWELHGQTVTVRWAKDSGGDIMVPCWERYVSSTDTDGNSDGDSDSDSDGGVLYSSVYIQPGQ